MCRSLAQFLRRRVLDRLDAAGVPYKVRAQDARMCLPLDFPLTADAQACTLGTLIPSAARLPCVSRFQSQFFLHFYLFLTPAALRGVSLGRLPVDWGCHLCKGRGSQGKLISWQALGVAIQCLPCFHYAPRLPQSQSLQHSNSLAFALSDHSACTAVGRPTWCASRSGTRRGGWRGWRSGCWGASATTWHTTACPTCCCSAEGTMLAGACYI